MYVGSLDGAKPKFLSELYRWRRALCERLSIFLSGNTLMAQKFDEAQLKLNGPTFVAAEGVSRSTNSYVAISVSRGGVLAYSNALLSPPGQSHMGRPRRHASQHGGPRSRSIRLPAFHDEKRLAASRIDAKSGNTDIYITELTEESRTQEFTFGPLVNAARCGHTTTRSLYSDRTETAAQGFYQKSSAGGGKDEPVLPAEALSQPVSFRRT